MVAHPTLLLETPATHPKSLFWRLDSLWNYFTEGLVTWPPLVSMARNNILGYKPTSQPEASFSNASAFYPR